MADITFQTSIQLCPYLKRQPTQRQHALSPLKTRDEEKERDWKDSDMSNCAGQSILKLSWPVLRPSSSTESTVVIQNACFTLHNWSIMRSDLDQSDSNMQCNGKILLTVVDSNACLLCRRCRNAGVRCKIISIATKVSSYSIYLSLTFPQSSC